ncbi:MAG TPA: branched-chain amino acid ABC transporter permease [Nitrososphaerales archaeon]|nr:branched-chain amino acid ABC transporter permease [Nitrososphaerales archaeon]
MVFDLSSLSFIVTILTLPAELFCIFLIISLTVNLEFGYAGIPNFGKVLFVAMGAYFAASLSYRLMVYVLSLKGDIFGLQAIFISSIDNHLTVDPVAAVELAVFMVVVGAVMGGLFGFLSSYPAIRLREDYLGMLLLAAGEFFNYFSQAYYPFLGGALGMTAPDPIYYLGTIIGQPDLTVLGVLALFAVLVYLYSERVGRSPLGRTLRAMRDNEVASEAMGKDNIALRRNVLIVSGAFAGIAGVLWLFYTPYIEPGTIGTFTRQTFTFIPFVIVILGGAANNRGVLLGTFVYLLIFNAFTQGTTYLVGRGINPFGVIDPTRIETMLIGVILLVILLRRPTGLIPEKPTLTMAKARLKEIADSVKAGKGVVGDTGQKQEPQPAK